MRGSDAVVESVFVIASITTRGQRLSGLCKGLTAKAGKRQKDARRAVLLPVTCSYGNAPDPFMVIVKRLVNVAPSLLAIW